MWAVVNEMDHDEMLVTAAEFWLARFSTRARWALSTTTLMCAYQGLGVCTGGRVLPAIEVGDVYFVTGDVIRTPAVTDIVLCASCADAEIPDEAFALT